MPEATGRVRSSWAWHGLRAWGVRAANPGGEGSFSIGSHFSARVVVLTITLSNFSTGSCPWLSMLVGG